MLRTTTKPQATMMAMSAQVTCSIPPLASPHQLLSTSATSRTKMCSQSLQSLKITGTISPTLMLVFSVSERTPLFGTFLAHPLLNSTTFSSPPSPIGHGPKLVTLQLPSSPSLLSVVSLLAVLKLALALLPSALQPLVDIFSNWPQSVLEKRILTTQLTTLRS